MSDKAIKRARDFWTSIAMFVVSSFFLYRTTKIPFFESATAGVDSAKWYDSAALVPYGIFSALLVLSFCLMFIAIRDGGARTALSAAGFDVDRMELKRLGAITLILAAYIFGLVPRTDFVLCSALVITALIWGFHRGVGIATYISTTAVVLPALYALFMNFDRSRWGQPHNDDWFVLLSFTAMTFLMFWIEHRRGTLDRIVRATPVVAILCPMLLVLVMAFGFRQNVPNRTGLLFTQIEYHYYVTLRPLWQGQ